MSTPGHLIVPSDLLARRVREAHVELVAALREAAPYPLGLTTRLIVARAVHNALTELADHVTCPTCGLPAGANILPCADCP